MEGNGAAARQRPFAGPRSFRRLTATRASSPAGASRLGKACWEQPLASSNLVSSAPSWRDRRSRSGVGGPGGEHAAWSDDGEPEHATPGLALWRPTALAGSAGQRVLLGLAVQVGDPGLHDLVVNGVVHHGLR